jgi:hypothetical protein
MRVLYKPNQGKAFDDGDLTDENGNPADEQTGTIIEIIE